MHLRQPRLGIALGSGSARGWAHIGVLRALEQAGIVPDVVSGASIGALGGLGGWVTDTGGPLRASAGSWISGGFAGGAGGFIRACHSAANRFRVSRSGSGTFGL